VCLPGAGEYNELGSLQGRRRLLSDVCAWSMDTGHPEAISKVCRQGRYVTNLAAAGKKKFVFVRPSLCAVYVSKISLQFSWHLPNRRH
jgi:hypothetical protein